MLDAFKKGVKLGIGLSFLTKEKLEKAAVEIGKKGRESNAKVKKTVANLSKDVEKEKKKLNGIIDKETQKKLRDLGYVSKTEAVKFLQKVKLMETKIMKQTEGKRKQLSEKTGPALRDFRKKAIKIARKDINQGLSRFADNLNEKPSQKKKQKKAKPVKKKTA